MIIQPITNQDALWEITAEYAEQCSWRAGKSLAKAMRTNHFCDWERVFVVLDEQRVIAYCTLSKTDCIPDIPYTPYIGYLFVDESHRGKRVSQELIRFVLTYAKGLGFDRVYLVSDHVNLYEKYGFIKIDEKPAPWNAGTMEAIFMHPTEY